MLLSDLLEKEIKDSDLSRVGINLTIVPRSNRFAFVISEREWYTLSGFDQMVASAEISKVLTKLKGLGINVALETVDDRNPSA